MTTTTTTTTRPADLTHPMPSAPTAAAARCRNHPELPAVAICVRCGKPVCAACSTRWEGMHHCISCLAARRAAAGERGAAVRTLGMVLLALALAAGATLLRAVAGAAIARLF